MLRSLAVVRVFAGALLLGMCTRIASAESNAEPVHLQYEAPATCPSEDAFFAAVMARTPRVRRRDDPSSGRTFVIRLTKVEEEFSGHLLVRTPDDTTTEREVAGDNCEEVVSALALIAALAIDPNAVNPATDAPPASGPTAVPAVRPSLDTPSAAPSKSATTTDAHPPYELPTNERRWKWGASAGAFAWGGASPRAMLGPAAAVAIAAPKFRWFRPTLRIAFARGSTGTVGVEGGSAAFGATLGILDGCPLQWAFGTLTLEPCLRWEAGALQAAGTNVVPARTDTHVWLAGGATARLEWRFIAPLFFESEGGFRVPIVRTTFFFEPDRTIYETAPVGGWVSVGIGAWL